jgi:hypothetical protein
MHEGTGERTTSMGYVAELILINMRLCLEVSVTARLFLLRSPRRWVERYLSSTSSSAKRVRIASA